MTDEENTDGNILPQIQVLYCGACGMPLEYCEYGPDFETHCNPWLKKNNPAMFQELRGAMVASKPNAAAAAPNEKPSRPERPDEPWTMKERLTAFYEKYVPEKIDNIPGLLEKYAGKEEKLFQALESKYGEEPEDPYDAYESDEDNNEGGAEVKAKDADDDGANNNASAKPSSIELKKRRGKAAKNNDETGAITRVVVQKVAQKKRRNLTIISGMETVAGLKLKDVSKAFSKKFAGSSSVKKTVQGNEEIIIQGDHVYDVAEMIVDKFKVAESAVFIDIGDGEIVPLRWLLL